MVETYFTGKPCPKGHIAARYKSSHSCVICNKEACARLSSTVEGRAAAVRRATRWATCNPDKFKRTQQRYAARHKAKVLAKSRARQALKRKSMPAWVDQQEIVDIYNQCDYISRLTDIPHEVDHIIPLQNSIVSGLHVPWNLQIISREENRRKSNLFQGTK